MITELDHIPISTQKLCQFWARIDQTNGAEASSIYEEGPVTSHSSTAFLKLMRPPSHPSKKTISWESNFKSLTKLFGQFFLGGKVSLPYSSPFLFNHPNQTKNKTVGNLSAYVFLDFSRCNNPHHTSLLHSGPDSDLGVQQLASEIFMEV